MHGGRGGPWVGRGYPRHTRRGAAHRLFDIGRVACGPCSPVEFVPDGVGCSPVLSDRRAPAREQAILGLAGQHRGIPRAYARYSCAAGSGSGRTLPCGQAEPAGRAEGSNLCLGQEPSSNVYPCVGVGRFRGRLPVGRTGQAAIACFVLACEHARLSRPCWGQARAGAWPPARLDGPSSNLFVGRASGTVYPVGRA